MLPLRFHSRNYSPQAGFSLWVERPPEFLADPLCRGMPFIVLAGAVNSNPACQTTCRERGTAGAGTGKAKTGPVLRPAQNYYRNHPSPFPRPGSLPTAHLPKLRPRRHHWDL